jgi:GDP-4-dehydro-6-deoxy-D-mannose reductase
MKQVLITGATGFAGGYLAEHLLSLGSYRITGVYRSDASRDSSSVKDRIAWYQADLTHQEEVASLVSDVTPDIIVHLAAQAEVGESFKQPLLTLHTNIDSQLFLFEAVKQSGLKNVRILSVLSADIYGYIEPEDLPIDEVTPFRPGNPYAVSKVACDSLSYQYWKSSGLAIIRARPFTHIGPRQKTGFVTSDFARQIALIEKGQQEKSMLVGNLDARRDFTDVRDVVRAYALLMESGEAGEAYNIGSGTDHAISEVLEYLRSRSITQFDIVTDPSKMRPSDIPRLVCDHTKLTRQTGWEPQIGFTQSLDDILDYWRSVI